MWISVKDKLPETGQMVDVWRRNAGRVTECCHYGFSTYRTALWNHRYGGYAGGATITHWMELPDPPQVEGASDATIA